MLLTQKIVHSCNKYELTVDVRSNRITIRIFRFWRSADQVPDYLDHWMVAVDLVKRGFTVLVDLKIMITHPQAIIPIHEEAIDITMNAGCAASAAVAYHDIAKMQMQKLYQDKGSGTRMFEHLLDAENYLDQF